MRASTEAQKLLGEIQTDRANYIAASEEEKRNFDHTFLYHAVEFILRLANDSDDLRVDFLKGTGE
jgi:hypothetical protein